MDFSKWEEEARKLLVGSKVDARVAAERAQKFRIRFALAFKASKRLNPHEPPSIIVGFALKEISRQSRAMKPIATGLIQRLAADDARLRKLVENSNGFRVKVPASPKLRRGVDKVRSFLRRRRR
ncbi:MAG: hypothetical protein AABW68_03015 [archaeon]